MHSLADPILFRRVVENRLIYEEVSITHTRYRLHEIDRVIVQVICGFLYLSPTHAISRPFLRYKELFIHCGNIDCNQVLDILCLLQRVIIDLTALLIL